MQDKHASDKLIFCIFCIAVVQLVFGLAFTVPTNQLPQFLEQMVVKTTQDPFQIGLFLGLFPVAALFLPSGWKRSGFVLTSLTLELLIIAISWQPAFIGVITRAGGLSAVLSVALLLILMVRRPQERRRILLGLCHGLTLPLLYAGSSVVMRVYVFSGSVYDMYYYLADLHLGPPLGFTISALATRQFWFYTAGYLIYFSLSHLMALVAGLWFHHRKGPNPNIFFIACALLGNVGYTQFPGVGPKNFFQHLFPFDPPAPLAPHVMDFPEARRSAMPSLHVMWSYAVWMGAVGLRLVFRRLALVYLLCMQVCAFLGPHYTVDIIAALGFAPAVHWWCRREKTRTVKDLGYPVCFLATLGYLGLLVWGSSVWIVWPWLLQGSSLLLLASSVYLSRRLYRRSLETPTKLEPALQVP